jgi:hypothetical protein
MLTAKQRSSFLSSCLYGCLTALLAPVQSTTAEDQKQNNDYQYGFHDFSPF